MGLFLMSEDISGTHILGASEIDPPDVQGPGYRAASPVTDNPRRPGATFELQYPGSEPLV
jgi:hypothetical protein